MKELPFCECGCGKRVSKKGNRFIWGHNQRGKCKKIIPEFEPKLCKCGCGGYTNPGKIYIWGHNSRIIPKSVILKWVEENQGKHLCKCGCGEYIIIKSSHYKNGLPEFISHHNVFTEENKKVVGDKNRINTINYWKNLSDTERKNRSRINSLCRYMYLEIASKEELQIIYKKISIGKKKWWDNLTIIERKYYVDMLVKNCQDYWDNVTNVDWNNFKNKCVTGRKLWYSKLSDEKKLNIKIKRSCTLRGILPADFDEFMYEKDGNVRGGSEYIQWRDIIQKRDNYTCQICGDCGCNNGGGLNVHHIFPLHLYPELVTDENNGVVLCHDCHCMLKGKEMDCIEMFLFMKNDISNPFMVEI